MWRMKFARIYGFSGDFYKSFRCFHLKGLLLAKHRETASALVERNGQCPAFQPFLHYILLLLSLLPFLFIVVLRTEESRTLHVLSKWGTTELYPSSSSSTVRVRVELDGSEGLLYSSNWMCH